MELTDQPSSICHIQSIHMYTLQSKDPQKPDPPFTLLTGEMVLFSGNSVDGVIVITNYRLYLRNGENQYHIPSGMIEVVEIRELFYLQLQCKDARTYRCTFENNETAMEWYERVMKAAEPPRQLEQAFAFYHCMWSKEKGGEDATIKILNQKKYTFDKEMFEIEMARMQFQGDSWRITKANENYKVCPTYPPYLLVPSCINDEMLESVAKFRSSRRIPVAVWRHIRNGAIIARCSQPEVGWFGWRSSDDEDLLKAISDACNFDRNVRATSSSDRESVLSHSPGSLHSDESLQITGEVMQQEKKLLIMDARSYTTAVANRARGGGCECPEYYPNCEIQFMNLANIHSIRKSFHALRQLCMSSAEQPNLLEGTRWLLHMSGLIKSAVTLATAVERDARPVLVHCSDGWDRTPQIVALAELLLDPYYRTVDGFRVLIEREWLAFGHKFADRCGQSGGSDDVNERCPVFLQWLDCVHQIMEQFPISFEFSPNYLIKIAQHTFSNLYGTFLCNTQKQRSKLVHGKTFSIWELLSTPTFRNHLYSPTQSYNTHGRVLWPKANIRDLRLWSEVYLGSMECNFNSEDSTVSARTELFEPSETHGNMSKTRSYGDLINTDASHGLYEGRRSSDPNVNREGKNAISSTTDNREDHSDDVDLDHVISESKENIKSVGDFLSSEIDDNQPDCNHDCIYNVHTNASSNLTDDQIDGLGSAPSGNMTRSKSLESDSCENALTNGLSPFFLKSEPVELCSDSDIESTRSERGSKAETDLDVEGFLEANNNSPPSVNGFYKGVETNGDLACNGTKVLDPLLSVRKSVETSTETLVSDLQITGSSPKGYNGFEKIINTQNSDIPENCKACVQDVKMLNDNFSRYPCNNDNPYILPWDRAYLQNRRYNSRIINCQLGEDGLMPIRSPIQERLDQIFDEQKRTVESLEKELHASRQCLIKQACHKCQNDDEDFRDDNGSVIESVNSLSECQASTAGESLRSDLSWVVVEDGSATEYQGKLWVADHAVSRCTGCGIEFCLGRRRHHCRKCDRIFCADCSDQSVCQLYNSSRMCTGCYSELRKTDRPVNKRTMESLDGCKQNRSCASEQSRQITASSN